VADVTVDVSQLTKLAADLRAHSRKTPAAAVQVVSKGALNIKNDWRKAWSGLAHAPSLPAAITYDTTIRVSDVEAEIGPDKARRQGSLGNIVEFGTAKNPPNPGGAPALEREEPRFVKAAEDLVKDPTAP
jgi:hypothetical protein